MLLQKELREGLNLLESIAFTGDLECAKILYEELLELIKFQFASSDITGEDLDQIRVAFILVEHFRGALRVTAALGHWALFDFLFKKAYRVEPLIYRVERSGNESVHLKMLERTLIYHQISRSCMIDFALIHNKEEFVSELVKKTSLTWFTSHPINVIRKKQKAIIVLMIGLYASQRQSLQVG